MKLIDHHPSLWQQRKDEHARQMRIVLFNTIGAVVALVLFLRWLP